MSGKPSSKQRTAQVNALVTANVGIAYSVMRHLRVLDNQRGFDDAKQEAMLALLLAAQSYDASKGATFGTWAWLKVSGHLKDWMTAQRKANVLVSSRRVKDELTEIVPEYAFQRALWFDLIETEHDDRDRMHVQLVEEAVRDPNALPDEQAYDREVEALIDQALEQASPLAAGVARDEMDGRTARVTDASTKRHTAWRMRSRGRIEAREVLAIVVERLKK